MGASEKGNFWDRIGVYLVIGGLFAGGAVIFVLLTQQLLSGNPQEMVLVTAAEKGDPYSQFALGKAYQDGTLGLKKDDAEGLKWIKRAAESGKPGSAVYQSYLCYMYLNGYHTSRDVPQAVTVCRKSAETGNAQGERLWGYMAYAGIGVQQDYAVAADWYEKGAVGGDGFASYMMGVIYREGRGRPKDLSEVDAWLQKALAQGYAPAGCELAMLHFDHGDTSVDDQQATKWLQGSSREDQLTCMNDEAWKLAVSPNAALRDPLKAETWAAKTVALAPDKPAYLDTLAAAYAAEGKFDEAVVQQQKAISKLPSTADYAAELHGMQDRLALYQQHKPYFDPRMSPAPAAATTSK